jgi:hypothetical protein
MYATTVGGLASESKSVEIVESSVATERLVLGYRSASFVVRDGMGTPVADVIASSAGRTIRGEDGVVQVGQVAPGARVILRGSGFAPVCRTAPRQGQETARLQASREVFVAEEDYDPALFDGEFTGIVGSTCPVPFAAFRLRMVGLRIYIGNFPQQSDLGFSTTGRSAAIQIGADGRLLFKR